MILFGLAVLILTIGITPALLLEIEAEKAKRLNKKQKGVAPTMCGYKLCAEIYDEKYNEWSEYDLERASGFYKKRVRDWDRDLKVCGDRLCVHYDDPNAKIDSYIKQHQSPRLLKNWNPEKISVHDGECREGKSLMLRPNGFFACVGKHNVQKLLDMDWQLSDNIQNNSK